MDPEYDDFPDMEPEPYQDELADFGAMEVDDDRQAGEFNDNPQEDDEGDEPDEGDDFYDRDPDDGDDRSMFADPGGESALRAATRDNPRNLPCPQCGGENLLTPADRERGYCCDRCATQNEGGGY
jgi:hypothetical protein